VKFIGAHRERWGVEPICTALQVAPSTYYAVASHRPSARQLSDERLKIVIARVHRENLGVYGIEKVWRQLKREGHKVGRDRVARLMDDLELSGVVRGKKKRTTIPVEVSPRPADLVERNFTATAPNRLWVSDLTYVSTWTGFVYVAFVIDGFSRFIVGWRVSNSLHAELALDALEMAIWRRQRLDLAGLIHHSDRGVQTGFKGSSQHCRGSCDATRQTAAGRSGTTSSNAVARPSAGGPSRGTPTLLGGNRQRPDERGRGLWSRDLTRSRSAVVPAKWRHAHRQSGPALGPLSLIRRAGGDRPLARPRLRRTRDFLCSSLINLGTVATTL